MSSRNAYLSFEERKSAICLVKGGHLARSLVKHGERSVLKITAELQRFLGSFAGVVTEYVQIVHQDSLVGQKYVDDDSLLAVAVKIGTTRLIDNFLLVGADESL
jgi:pantoate--beta-alanine ligase